MKVTAVRQWTASFITYNATFIRIETDEGVVGEAEVAMRRRTRTVESLITELGEYLIGKDPTRIEQHSERMYRDAYLGGNLLTIGISGIDQALWDLNGRALGVPVHRLLGGKFRDSVPMLAVGVGLPTIEDLVPVFRDCIDRGFRALMVGLPGFYSPRFTGDAANLIVQRQTETELLPRQFWVLVDEYFQAAREAAGNDVDLTVDCHGRLNVANAVRLCEVLEPYGLAFIEEPVPAERVDWMREVSLRSTTPIAAGERWGNHYSSAPFIESHSVAVAEPDIGLCGGITVAKKIASAAESHGISMCFHNPFGPLQSAAMFHLAATLPNLLWAETSYTADRMELWNRYTEDPPDISTGKWIPTETPGFGPRLRIEEIEANPAILELDVVTSR